MFEGFVWVVAGEGDEGGGGGWVDSEAVEGLRGGGGEGVDWGVRGCGEFEAEGAAFEGGGFPAVGYFPEGAQFFC